MRNRAKASIRCMLLVAGVCAAAQSAQGPPALEPLLAKMQRVATLYRDLALKFECTETIRYRALTTDWRTPAGYVRLSYLYERDAQGKLTDCRTWPKSITNAGNYRCVDPSEYNVPLYLNNAYSWVFVFLEARQPWHTFRLAREEQALGRPAVVVDFEPRGEIRHEFNDWYGRAWIDRDTHQFLRVEAYLPDDWKAKLQLDQARTAAKRDDEHGPDFEIASVVTEFGEIRNGMRFASRAVLRRSRYFWSSDYKEKNAIDVEQTYSKYRFFDVATTAEIEKIVKGD